MLKLIAIVAAGYGALVVTVYLMQGRMLYLANVPGRELTATPADVGLVYEDVAIRSEDGVMLHGWLIPGNTPRTLLFFHGNAGNISHRLDSIRQFHQLGLSIFIIDYRGYGQSDGRPGEAGIYHDADGAWRYLTQDLGMAPDDIIVFGRSMGASAAAKLAAAKQPLALIVESSFTSVPDIAQELYPWLPARWLSRLRHATRDYVADVGCPVLVVHSEDDEIVPFHHGEAIYAAANEPRTFLSLRGGHNEAWLLDEVNYINGLRDFIRGLGR
jgi:fermentation-respiration switch protein FrsA (DUF1100 family)